MAPAEKKKAIKGLLVAGPVSVFFAALMVNIHPTAEQARAFQAEQAKLTAEEAQARVEKQAAPAEPREAEKDTDCLSGWDGSFPPLVDAVKRELRNPRSFELVDTVRSPVDKTGTFDLIMTYRAQNGFGGMNVEAIGVEVDAKTCAFRRVSNETLAKRLQSAPS